MRSSEGQFSTELVKALNNYPKAYFRKVSDRAQIGIPDIIGCYDAIHVEIEVKHESIMDVCKALPTKHPFTGPQLKELNHMQKVGAAAIGIISCGSKGWAFPADCLNSDGKIFLAIHENNPLLAQFDLSDILPLIKLIKEFKSNAR